MIYTERTVKVKKGISTIDEPIVLYRGDRKIELQFEVINPKLKFSEQGNIIVSTQAYYGQLAITGPNNKSVFSEIVKTKDGIVVFEVTADMIDELGEVGFYSFHIRLFDEDLGSRITLPPIENGIEVREPLISEDGEELYANTVGYAIVGYTVVDDSEYIDIDECFDEDGNYLQTVWNTGDTITQGRLNKIEDALRVINSKAENNMGGGSTDVDLSGLATKDELNAKADVDDIPTKVSQLTNDSNFATEEYVNNKIDNIQVSGGGDVSSYWAGKNMVATGDSIPQGSHLADTKNAFPYKIASALGMSITNYSIGGSTLSKAQGAYEKCYVSLTQWNEDVANGLVDTTKSYLVKTGANGVRPYNIYTYTDGAWVRGGNSTGEAKYTPVCDRVAEMDTSADVVFISVGTNDFIISRELGDFETLCCSNTMTSKASTPVVTGEEGSDIEIGSVSHFSQNLIYTDETVLHENSKFGESTTECQIIADDTNTYYVYKHIPLVAGSTVYAPNTSIIYFLKSDETTVVERVDVSQLEPPYQYVVPSGSRWACVMGKYESVQPSEYGIYTKKMEGYDTENIADLGSATLHNNSKVGTSTTTQEISADSTNDYYVWEKIPVTGGKKIFAPFTFNSYILDASGEVLQRVNLSSSSYQIELPSNATHITVTSRYKDILPEHYAIYQEEDTGYEPPTEGDTSTFYNALHTTCRYLLNVYKNKDIIFVTPIKRSQTTSSLSCIYPEDKNNVGHTLKDYRDAIIEVCEYYSIPYIDLYALSGLNPHIDPNMFDDNVHPTLEGHIRMASVCVAQMKTFRS